jgi:Hg(II)-responsive transcriptional regulator
MSLRTGEVARQAGVNVETLRFYEREGILPKPPRLRSGYREYPPETVNLIRFVKRAQELGFSLKEVQGLLSLRKAPRRASGKVPRLVKAKIEEIDHKIRDLTAIRRGLGELLGACQAKESGMACPIIASLSGCPKAKSEVPEGRSR